jgi:hypothetical protein
VDHSLRVPNATILEELKQQYHAQNQKIELLLCLLATMTCHFHNLLNVVLLFLILDTKNFLTS